MLILQKKRFHNRETIATLNYESNQMSFIHPFLPKRFNNTPFLNLGISANHDKVKRLKVNAMVNSLRGLFLNCRISFIPQDWKYLWQH